MKLCRSLKGWAFVVLVFTGATQSLAAQCKELGQVNAGDGGYYDQFGAAIAAAGNLMVVGAPYDYAGTDYYSGSAYVFRHNGTTWVEEGKLVPTDPVAYDYFGSIVATDGVKVVVGVPGRDGAAVDSGVAYVFAFNGSAWFQEGKLVPGDPAAYDYFGSAVAIAGAAAAVGAPREESSGTDRGAVYVFRKSAAFGWLEERKVTASDAADSDYFGDVLAMEGTTLLVSATRKDANSQYDNGKVYVLKNSGTNWPEQQGLTASDGLHYDHFGSTLLLRGALLLIGASGVDGSGTYDAGEVYEFLHNGSQWNEGQQLAPSTLGSYDYFGSAISTDGTVIAIGAPGTDLPANGAGSVYSFLKHKGSWGVEQRLQASTAAGGHAVGTAVAVRGNRVLGSSPSHDGAASYSGTLFEFSVNEFVLEATPDAVNPGDNLNFLTYPGEPGSLYAFCLADVNGIPFFMGLLYPLFQGDCQFSFTLPAPGGLSGIDLGFVSVKIDAFGKVAITNTEHVQFL